MPIRNFVIRKCACKMLSTVVEISASLIDSILGIYFVTRFTGCPIRKNRWFMPAIVILTFVTLLSDWFLPGFNLLAMFFIFFVASLYGLCVCRKYRCSYARGLLASCIFTVSIIICSSLLYTIVAACIQDFGQLMQGYASATRYIYLLLDKVLYLHYSN